MTAEPRVARNVFARFLPGCAAVMASVAGGIGVVAPHEVTAAMILTVVTELVAMTAGFGAVLMMSRLRLRSIPRLGIGSFEAGLLAPAIAGVISYVVPDVRLVGIALLSALAGAVAGALALPQLLRRPQPADRHQLMQPPALAGSS